MRRELFAMLAAACLLGAGCASQKPSATAQPSVPAGWQSTKAPDGSFHFMHPVPEDWPVPYLEGDLAFDLGMTVTGTKAIDVPRVSLIVRRVLPGSEDTKGCYYSEQGWNTGREPATSTKSYGGHDFCIDDTLDAGAGNRYFTRSYATKLGNGRLVFQFTVHSTECSNYDDPSKCLYFDQARDTQMMESIMQTVGF